MFQRFALLVVILGLLPAIGRASEVRFVVFGDSQFGHPHVFERIVHETNLLRPDFVTCVGDMIHGYTDDRNTLLAEWRRYKMQIEPLTMPFYPVPGNHDVLTPESHEVYGEIWGEDRYFYSWDVGDLHMISLDTFHKGEDDRIMPWQIEWLVEDLEAFAERHGGVGSEELNSKSIFLFLHSPLWRYDPEHEGRHDWETIHKILLDYPVKMVFGGHTHELVWEERDGIEYVVVNSTGRMPQRNERGGWMHAFLHVSVVDGDVRASVIRAGSVLPIDTVNNEERKTIPPHAIRGGILRIPGWDEGEPLEFDVTVPIENQTSEEREYKLIWDFPRGSDVTVEPANIWLDIPGESSLQARFSISSDSAPSRNLMPRLQVETSSRLRTGAVDRQWEAIYQERAARAEAGEDILPSAIRLEDTFTFDATWSLYVPPTIVAQRRQGPITIDGIFDEADWQTADEITDFSWRGPGAPPQKTSIRFLYDDDYLYIAAWMEEPNPEKLKADAGGEIPLTWNDDDIEFLFDPLEEGRDHTRLFQNAGGTRFNAKPIGMPDRYFQSAYESAIHVGDDHWAIEFQIPWSDIVDAGQPEPGTRWAINVMRHRPQSDPTRYYWAVDGYAFGRYGALLFQ